MTPSTNFLCSFLALLLVAVESLSREPTALGVLTATQSLSGDNTLVSPGGIFELGFFRPGNSGYYLGIWYRNVRVRTYVWVANRDEPLANSSAILRFGDQGKIVLVDSLGNATWSSSQTKAVNPVLQLLDSGNLVVREGNSGSFLWQSFDFPTDTLLPGMKLGWDLKANQNRYLTSWRSSTDPSTGEFSFSLDPRGFPEILLRENHAVKYRSGPWNGERFSGVPEMAPTSGIHFSFVENTDEVYYSFMITNSSIVSRLTVNLNGDLERYTWMDGPGTWSRFWYAPKDQCDSYRECGAYGVCDSNASPVCQCPKGFEARNPAAWELRDGSGGCVRKTEMDCRSDGFREMERMKLPESSAAIVERNLTTVECRKRCLENCSCTAFASADVVDGGTGCVMWSGDLIDLRNYAEGGQPLFLRLAASDLDNDWTTKRIIVIVAAVFGGLVLLLGLCIIVKRKTLRRMWKTKKANNGPNIGPREKSQDFLLNEVVISKRDFSGERDQEELDLPLFDYSTIVVATNNFSDEYKLGQGGFGCVHKGLLIEGQEVAVKRLSKNSGQGTEEFKNEVRLIARLQHINLVRLVGCCVEMDEKMLIYEYMENRSLDSFLFSKTQGSLLDWQKRFNIINGVARGLIYLHQDSRFRIIHRDLKASNVLLDGEWTPKISDFGMARIFGRDQTEANTRRVVGTYGYMAPEYAMDGLFSVKSDAFSFGVLVLEIVSGKKNRGFYYQNNELNLLGHAWNLWKEGKALEIIDAAVGDSYNASEVLRCIQVGLLCVQERAEDRPSMSSVVLMLSSETATMTQPKNPGFCLGRSPAESESLSSRQEDQSCTVNQMTVTVIDGR